MGSFTTTDGVRLDYLDEGTGDPVVLVAGFCAPATSWALTADPLVEAGYRAISFDRRGHGTSESTARGQRMARHGADLLELLDRAQLDRPVLVGGSMGANVVWSAIDLAGPSPFRGVVTVDQTPRMRNGVEWDCGFYGCTDENVVALFADGVPDTGRGRRVDPGSPAVARLIARLGAMPAFADPTGPGMLDLLRDHATQDWRDVIDHADLPILMVAGRESQVWPAEHAERAVARNQQARAVVVEEAGHAVNFDRPDEFAALLLEFLGDLPAR